MSIYDEKFMQLHKALRAMSDVILEFHTGSSESTQKLELEMYKLDELMKGVDVTVDMVRDLRNLTGEGMMACRKALIQARGDEEKAVDYLRTSGNI